MTNCKQINNKRTIADLYKDVVLVTRLHKSRDSNACLSDGSDQWR